jgi:hypothetical protein
VSYYLINQSLIMLSLSMMVWVGFNKEGLAKKKSDWLGISLHSIELIKKIENTYQNWQKQVPFG